MVKKNVCVFISGKGTNLKNLIIKSRSYNCPISIKLVICNKEKATGIKYAKINSIPYLLINTNSRGFERKILISLRKYKISLICLAGYMKILSREFLKNFRKKIINIHPSLLPKFKGLDTFTKVLKNKEIKTGCTVHYVNEKLDNGKNIVQKSFFISLNDDKNSLKVKTQQLEYIAYPEAIIKIFRYTNF
tara:strand:- start:3118 stop:3687 length:570 start_codon:yes stop_codon:yes gene_type:complete